MEYLRLTLAFVWGSALPEDLISVFQEVFTSISEIFILAGGLGTGLSFMEFRRFSDISKFPKVLSLK